ncbi:MAG: 4,5-DOPA dioxygenase extradiol [Burkholderiales bacterium]|nr:4,5-DOPA dioxygenase extradiol [Burkholderiales bacterium]
MNNLKMPALFIGHGSPMNAIENNEITREWQKLGELLPTPRAILVISAHWYITDTALTYQDNNQTIHDFYGFPEELATYSYPSISSKSIAAEIKDILGSGIDLLSDKWGLDHGAWSVLTHIYSKPTMPILQLSINIQKTPQWHFELGQKLAKLREQGIMLIASGNIVHNLSLLSWHKPNLGNDWAIEFDNKVIELIQARNFEPLINYQQLTASALMAVPTPEHYLPLLYILGASSISDKLTIFNQKYNYGSLSMTSIISNE